ncbi:MAG: DUF3322 and DUF2220 domain-containing protein [Gammaproteobacteria bacterium]|nr:MAG: DUF3322 and DUF2220 domain-containing protein [Gammaproteobacteria bacterium]
MAKSKWLDPEALIARLRTRCQRQRSAWLQGEGEWPLRLPLGVPTEREAQQHLERVHQWVEAWNRWPGPGRIEWAERRWSSLGRQQVPERITFDSPLEAMSACGLEAAWRTAEERLARIRQHWPTLASHAVRNWTVLAEWPENDFERLWRLLDWLLAHPDSGLLIRQLPVPGVDGKWLEGHRRVVTDWLARLQGREGGEDLYALAGLRRLPVRLRMRILDADLRRKLGGLGDIEAPVEDIAALDLPLSCVFIVENLQTGLAFGDLPGTIVFMKQGYAVEPFAEITWLRKLPVYYWGDLDTNGLAILSRLRTRLPGVRSLLMDEKTLLDHRPLWGHEPRPAQAKILPGLTEEESELYRGLRENRWGPGVRLEQERIDWDYAWQRIRQAVGVAGSRPHDQ